MKNNPPFRAEHIGSLLRPAELRNAFRAVSRGELAADEFRAIQDKAIRDVVALQRAAGLKVAGDGEFRRASYWGHWVAAIDGLSTAPASFTFHDETGVEQSFIAADCTGPLSRTAPISTEEYRFLAGVSDATVKITMPSPSTLHFWRLGETIAGSGYGSDEDYFADLCAIYAREIADLHDLGCRYVQLDEVPLIMLANPNIQQRVRDLGDDPERLSGLYIQAMNDAVAGRPDDMTAGMHICRGNFKGRWLTEGGYDDMAERVFGEVGVDVFFLEYDSELAGDFTPLRYVPDNKRVVLGLVSTKTAKLEAADELKRRIEEASRYVPLERLSISPQCGFASTVAGNPLSEAEETAKLELLVEVAQDVWGSA